MFNVIRVVFKYSYILLITLILVRVIFKFFGISYILDSFSFIFTPIYGFTDFFIAPISFLLDIFKNFLPGFTHKFFPLIKIIDTNGVFEWAAIISVGVYAIMGIILEHILQIFSDYEKAFINVTKSATSTAIIKHKDEKLKKIKQESEMLSKRHQTTEETLRSVYNVIIKRLDREKTELVNKNISLEKELITDTLTGLRTKKYLNDRIKYEFNAAKTRKGTLSIIMIDIDHFKKINDTYGHNYGDLVLKETSRIIMNHCKGNTVAARYGGEEITIICPKLDLDETSNFAEFLRSKIEDELQLNFKNKTPITISAGVATFNSTNIVQSPEQLIEFADSALYEAKFLGRNQVRTYTN